MKGGVKAMQGIRYNASKRFDDGECLGSADTMRNVSGPRPYLDGSVIPQGMCPRSSSTLSSPATTSSSSPAPDTGIRSVLLATESRSGRFERGDAYQYLNHGTVSLIMGLPECVDDDRCLADIEEEYRRNRGGRLPERIDEDRCDAGIEEAFRRDRGR